MKNKLLLFALTLMICHSSFAQSWQWGKRGGCNADPSSPEETVVDMATDKNGNVYILSNINNGQLGSSGINIDGHVTPMYGSTDIAIASFACDGTYRWSKAIGCASGDNGTALSVDSTGNVYVTGFINASASAAKFDADTNVGITNKSLFLVKYDSSGHYKWLRMPQPDTVGPLTVQYVRSMGMDIDNQGNIHVLCALTQGLYSGTYNVTSLGIHILEYGPSGNLQSGKNLNINSNQRRPSKIFLNRISESNKFYVSGTLSSGETLSISGNNVNGTMYVSKFENNGSLIWLKHSSAGKPGIGGKPALDKNGNIFLAGYAYQGDNFNGHSVNRVNPDGGPFVVAVDSNGNNLWAQAAEVNAASAALGATISNNRLAVIGYYPGSLQWPGYSKTLNQAFNSGYNVFITLFDKGNGKVVVLDTIPSSKGYDEAPSCIVSDNKSNVYVGGKFGGDMRIGSDTIVKIGGMYDWFVAKYGSANCADCVTPVAAFSKTVNGTSVVLQYTGTQTVDSVHWDFGNGTSQTVTTTAQPLVKTYTKGSYRVCATAYNACGTNTFCDSVHIKPTSVEVLTNDELIASYPNPATETLNITYPITDSKVTIRIMDIQGRVVGQQQLEAGSAKATFDVRNYIPSVYMYQVIDGETVHSGRVVITKD